jgi:large subunit ribosomal protein L24
MLLKVQDTVVIITGADRSKQGKILKIDREKNKVIVEGVGRVWKHVRKSQKNPQGGRLNKEMPISASNVMFIDPSTGQPTRLGVRFLADGSKERYAKKSGKGAGVIRPAHGKSVKKS